eukprot:scaffold191171_cov31-Tisochrysis_lutea.AAC.1
MVCVCERLRNRVVGWRALQRGSHTLPPPAQTHPTNCRFCDRLPHSGRLEVEREESNKGRTRGGRRSKQTEVALTVMRAHQRHTVVQCARAGRVGST